MLGVQACLYVLSKAFLCSVFVYVLCVCICGVECLLI
jgi:hypothetical protein